MKADIPLKDIVNQALFELGEQGTHKFETALYHGMQCVKWMNRNRICHEIKTIELPISPAKTAKLPADFIDYLKVGVVVGDKVSLLRLNPRLAPHNKRESGTYRFVNFYGDENGRNFGGNAAGINKNGEFKMDIQNGLILFNSDVQVDCVLLEYQTNGLNPSGSTCVHPYTEQAIINYIKWKAIDQRRDYSLSEKDYRKREYQMELKNARSNASRFTLKEFLDATRSGTSLGV